MEHDFWLKAWQDKQIGFHQSEYNQMMVDHYKDIDLEGKTVFIPLAGKSKDINYFLERGANVIANELSALAVNEYFEENDLDFDMEKQDHHITYISGNLRFIIGDFFKLNRTQLGHIDYLYDRACIVALPLELREKFFKKMNSIIKRDTDIFILTFSHDGPLEFGPPFYVPEKEIKEAYESMGHDLFHDVVGEIKAQGRFEKAGITKMKRIKWYKQI